MLLRIDRTKVSNEHPLTHSKSAIASFALTSKRGNRGSFDFTIGGTYSGIGQANHNIAEYEVIGLRAARHRRDHCIWILGLFFIKKAN